MKRKKIGLTFLSNYKDWAGGVIYILNIIHALKLLEDEQKPELYIYYRSDSPIEDVKAICYPYITFHLVNTNPSFVRKCINYATTRWLQRTLLTNELADIIYPDLHLLSYGKRPVHWIPDLQHYYLPQMSSEQEVKSHLRYHLMISQKNGIVVFSSKDAMNDFKKFYPEHKCELRLLSFASTLPDPGQISIGELRKKFGIDSTYFMSPNQFWKHKNHKLVLEAIASLKNKNLDFQVVFTGSESDHRNKDHFKSLKNYTEEQDLGRWVKFLGFIRRDEQLKLMKHARAIIQPSLFEGWSTVVEDAKAQNLFILLSNLRVHQEQVNQNCRFFDPHDHTKLADLIESMLIHHPEIVPVDYDGNIKSFANQFIEVVKYE